MKKMVDGIIYIRQTVSPWKNYSSAKNIFEYISIPSFFSQVIYDNSVNV